MHRPMKGADSAFAPLSPFQRPLGQVDWLMLAATVGLLGIGVLIFYIAIQSNPDLLMNSFHCRKSGKRRHQFGRKTSFFPE